MSDSVQPHRRQPTRLPHPWDSPGKNTGVVCHFLLQCMKVKSESEVAQSYLLVTPWTTAHQAPPSMGFSRQEYWSGVPLPSPGDLPYPGIKSKSALQADSLPSEPPGKPVPFILRALGMHWRLNCLNVIRFARGKREEEVLPADQFQRLFQ